MIRLLAVIGITAFSFNANAESWVKGNACDSQSCVSIIDDPMESITLQAKIPGNKGKGMARFLEIVSYTTGEAIGALTGMMDGIRATVHGAGYNTFKGELSGPSGSINFDYNFEDGSWNVSSKGSGSVSSKTGHQ